MKEVFISYSSIDFAEASTVRSVLEQNGLSCWMAPRDIPGGSNYTKEIPIAIRNCTVFLLILSQNAQNSHWVLKELDSAVNNGKVILPFMLEDCSLNDEFNFLLTGAQRYDAYRKKAEALETLVGRVRNILGVSPTDTPSPLSDPEPEAPMTVPQKSEPKAPVARCTNAKCTACGGDKLKLLKNKTKCENMTERLTKLLIPVLSVLCMVAGVTLSIMIFPYDFLLVLCIAPLSLVLGGFWGARIARNSINRNRFRSGFSYTCYRCERCDKVFNHKEPLDN